MHNDEETKCRVAPCGCLLSRQTFTCPSSVIIIIIIIDNSPVLSSWPTSHIPKQQLHNHKTSPSSLFIRTTSNDDVVQVTELFALLRLMASTSSDDNNNNNNNNNNVMMTDLKIGGILK
jgi:hypothetical protein